jgi:acetyl-CoA carboxylase biotin carboxylase subunit
MIEEAPSVAVTPALRKKMGDTAVRAARAAGYVNAGTCEFLLDKDGEFYFLEMNTRLQVEHPVTELVTGIDLVQWQLRVASGEKLPFKQEDISPRGWAIECRITSEDAANNFLPSTGQIEHLHLPTGPGVRWDGGIESGSEVGLYYDPMLAKLIVWGADREQALTRMRRALVDLVIQGVETSRDFHIRVMDDEEFRRGDIDIQWLERRLASILERHPAEESVRVAAIAAALLAERDRSARAVSGGASEAVLPAESSDSAASWKQAARFDGLRG